ncbi:hypothetical protein CM15mP35_03860 [bacterium]|nr:MAG: hypothetical protein CM15mV39_0250 [uncultured marine virus]GIR20125.1 MAG: hypothetical protein CM15mP35_03860 [bacterium]
MYDKPSIWLRRYVPEDSNSRLWYFDDELKDYIYLLTTSIKKQYLSTLK